MPYTVKEHRRLHTVWLGLRNRCNNPKTEKYPRYGGRGIKVCSEWDIWENFAEWAYANGYDRDAPKMQCTLDRIDNNGNYCPENCRWVSNKEQQRNTSQNVYLTFDGETLIIQDWSTRTGISVSGIRNRLDRGWSVEDTLSTPKKKSRAKGYLYKGKSYTIAELCVLSRLSYDTIRGRIERGWDIERIVDTPKQVQL
jgi:predicted nucleic acid-binding Zn ribbon protein